MNVLNFYLHNIEELHYDLTLLTNNIGIKKNTKNAYDRGQRLKRMDSYGATLLLVSAAFAGIYFLG